MANNLYDKARESFLKAEINWLGGDIYVALVGKASDTAAAYVAKTSGPESHQFLSDIPVANILAVAPLQTVNTTQRNDAALGVANGNSVEFTVSAGIIQSIVIYKNTGNRSTSRLIAYLDDLNGNGINYVATAGENIKVQWDDKSANKIFKL